MARKQASVYKIKVLGLNDIKTLNTEIDKLNGKFDDLKKGGDDTTNTTKGFGVGLGRLAKGAVAATAALAAFSKISKVVTQQIKQGVEVFKGYEFEMQKVRAISGANEKEFRKLNKTAQELGRSTFFTAQQVAALQLNFSKLGFTSAEILQVQEAALLGATATGEDLARTATVIGSTVRGFGLDATEGARVADVMAASFTSSALTLEKFQTSMTKVSPVAKLLGMDLEETTAVMGVLTDAGIEASIAGTSLRNIFLKLGDPSSDLAKSIGFTVNSGEDMVREFRRMRDEGVNVEKMLEIVDVRQVAAISTMIEHIDKIESQTKAFRNSAGAAKDMADIIQASLQGATLKFQSALDGLRIVLVQKIAPALTSTLNVFSDFFNILAKFSDVTVADELRKEQTALIDYEIQLLNTNISEERRVELIEKLKTLHPSILGNIDSETASNKLLRDSLQEINNQLEQKILLSIEDEKLQEKAEITAEKFNTLRAKRQEVRDRMTLLINKQKTDAAEYGIELSDEEFIKLDDNLSLREQALNVEEQFSKFYRDNFAGNIKALSDFGSIINNMTEAEFDYTEAQTNSILAMEEKKKLMIELGIFEKEEEKKKKKKKNNGDGDIDDKFLENLELKNQILLKDRMLEIEQEIAEGKHQLQQFYVEGRIKSEAELNQAITEMTLERYNKELNLLNKSSSAHLKVTNKKIELQSKEKAAQEKAQAAKNKATQEDIQNIILHSETAKDAFAQILSMKINEILVNAMSSLFEDKTLPFLAKVGIAVGMKALITPLISNLLGGNGGGTGSTRGETVEVGNQFANGGLTRGGMFQGASHDNGGVKFRVGGRIHEAEGGEAIINKRSTSMFRPVLSAINSYNGNGVKFADGGLLNSGEKFAMGGELRSAQQLISGGMGSSKVVIVESDMTDVQNRISAIESQATF